MTSRIDKPATLHALGEQLERVAARQAPAPHARWRHRVRSALLVGGTVVVFAGGAGVATGLVSLSDSPDFVARQATAQLSPDLAARLSGLDRPRVANDSLGAAAAFVSGSDGPAPGSSLRLTAPEPPAGTPHTSPSTVDSWALPTEAGTVALEQMVPGSRGGPGSGVSADVSMLDAGHAFMTTDNDLIGLAPDGVASVDVRLAGGETVRLPVVGNVYGAQFDTSVQGVVLNGGGTVGNSTPTD